MSSITVLMYHYVREIAASPFPRIKGLEFSAFQRQLDYLEQRFTLISIETLINFCKEGRPLPERAALLTFDDGYSDHVRYALPELEKRGLSGAFFPPVKAVRDRELLDMNALHYVLASCEDSAVLVSELHDLCSSFGLSAEQIAAYQIAYSLADRFDTKEITYVKRMLQHVLEPDVRRGILDILFEKYVEMDRSDFAEELYFSVDDAKQILARGSFVGAHGYRHVWLNEEDRQGQELEIDKSIEFLAELGMPTRDWVMCYAFGGYNHETLEILRERECLIGFASNPGVAKLDTDNLLELPRYDTNDFPQ